MQVETLKIFCDVIETQSFSKAAMLNYISQSAVSQQIRGLEEKYDRKLIERGKRNLAPTQAGQMLYDGAKEILERFRMMENRIQVLSKTIAGSLRVSTVYSVGLHELPAYLKEFLRRYPSANIHVEYSRANKIYDDLVSSTIDLGIVAYPVRRSGIEVIPFREDDLVLICSPENPLAKNKKIDVTKLARARFVAFERDIPTRRAIDRLLRARSIPLEIVMEFDNIETIKRAVEINAGVSIVPSLTILNEIATGTLASVELTGADMKRPLGILAKKGKERTQVMEKFIEVLREGPPKETPRKESA
ncbi:MAG: LysR family transcriptional regulator [Candidatus Eisenbacteria bacterium]|nr:LysR family transcriptional regulator [Candidatus Latescibacterota bacterium]MBD3303415.1 LysR family transcriptional regulator [Candidatus Eisenbacteria bacterium]